MTTIKDVLTDARHRIAPVSASDRLDTQLLVAEALGVDRAYVIAHPEYTLTSEEADRAEAWIARRATGEPVAYILGRRAFYDRDIHVTHDVLIPRPETEHLVEEALSHLSDRPLTVVDVGTGSGAVAVTIKANAPQATVYATDVSPAALDVARENARQHATPITFYQGDLLEPVVTHTIHVDMVLANLPYICTEEMPQLDVSKYEPALALDGGSDGLTFIRRCMTQAVEICNPGAVLLFEIGAAQGDAARALAEHILKPESTHIVRDLAGHDRVLSVTCR